MALHEKLSRIQADRRKAGKGAVLGAETVLAQPILSTPASTEELFQLNPRLAFRDWTRKAQACSGWLAFQFGYRAALKDYREGDHEAVFPHGTYAMRVRFGVKCRERRRGLTRGPERRDRPTRAARPTTARPRSCLTQGRGTGRAMYGRLLDGAAAAGL